LSTIPSSSFPERAWNVRPNGNDQPVRGVGSVRPRATQRDEEEVAENRPPRKAPDLDPANFVRIYEASRARGEIPRTHGRLIYSWNENEKETTTKLTADENSTLIIVPDRERMNPDMPLNRLFISAQHTHGDKTTPIEVVGYSEIGKAQNAALA